MFIAASSLTRYLKTNGSATFSTRPPVAATHFGFRHRMTVRLRTRFLELLSSLPVSASTEVTVVLDVIGANKSPQCEHT